MQASKRKIYFIKKDFQSRFILRFVAIATAWAAISSILFAYLAKERLAGIRYSSHVDITTMRELLLPTTVGAHVVSLLIFAGILAYTIRTLWKRLDPPLRTIKNDLSRIAGGGLSDEFTIGKVDEFQDLAADLDAMRTGLREKVTGIKERHRELSDAADALGRSILEGKPSASQTAMLQSAVERMKRDIDSFQC
jgi:methyl-accepting chemotaxis protein